MAKIQLVLRRPHRVGGEEQGTGFVIGEAVLCEGGKVSDLNKAIQLGKVHCVEVGLEKKDKSKDKPAGDAGKSQK